MDLTSDMERDVAGAFAAPTDEDLASIANLANKQLTLERQLEEQQELLKQIGEDLAQVREVAIPNLLEKLGMTEFKLIDGSMVSVKDDLYAAITKENQAAAFSWLEETGNDGIIKNEVKVPFGKGQDEQAKQLLAVLDGHGFSYTNVRNVHPQTLRAFVRGQIEDGRPVPVDLFSIHIKKVATVKLPKGKR
jgi:hypothetical protein